MTPTETALRAMLTDEVMENALAAWRSSGRIAAREVLVAALTPRADTDEIQDIADQVKRDLHSLTDHQQWHQGIDDGVQQMANVLLVKRAPTPTERAE